MNFVMPIYETMIFLFTGVFFCVGVGFICPDLVHWIANYLSTNNVPAMPNVLCSVVVLVVFFELGRIINYVAQIFEHKWLCRILSIEYYDDYSKYNEIEKEFPKLTILSRERTVARNHAVMFVIFIILSACRNTFCNQQTFFFLFCFAISLRAYKHFVIKLNKLVYGNKVAHFKEVLEMDKKGYFD